LPGVDYARGDVVLFFHGKNSLNRGLRG